MDTRLVDDIKNVLTDLSTKNTTHLNMVVGIDGFVDEIIHVVDKRQDFDSYTKMNTIADFGNRILKASGFSTNIELVPAIQKLGGNGPILANALLNYDVNITYIGALGLPDIHPVFKSMAEKCHSTYSLSDPGHTDALEFNDGKLMLGKLTSLNELTWERFKKVVGGVEKIAELVKTSHLFGMENWTMIPYMSSIWEGFISEVFPLLPDLNEKPFAFFDLCDPEKHTKEDTYHAMKLIGKFEQKFKTILGLNEKELYEIALVLNIHINQYENREENIKNVAQKLHKALGIYCLVVHPTKEALACIGDTYYYTTGPFCEKPILTTGAGDNFNAGFVLGQALGLDPQGSLLLGVGTSGYYVRNAKSPSLDQLITFLENWSEGKI